MANRMVLPLRGVWRRTVHARRGLTSQIDLSATASRLMYADGGAPERDHLRNEYCTKRPQYHYTRYTPSSAAGLSLILRMDRSTSAMIRLLTRGDQLVDPLSGVQRRPVRHPAPSRLVSSISGSGDPVASVSITRGGRVGQAVHTPVVSVPVYHQARVTRLVAADVPPLNAFPIILRRVRLDRDGKCQWVCIGGEKRLEVWPESHWPGFALRQADVLQSYTA